MATLRADRHTVTGDRLLGRFKELIHDRGITRVTILDEQQRPILVLPMSPTMPGAVVVPMFVAIGAISALSVNYTLEIERSDPPPAPPRRSSREMAKVS